MGVSRASLYYVSKQMLKDWAVKIRMEEELRRNPSYGSRRLAQALGVNRKRTQRVMHMFGVKPYRRRGKRYADRRSRCDDQEDCSRKRSLPTTGGHPWRRTIHSGLPTIQELAGSAEGSNGVECDGWSTQRPANAPDCRRVEAPAV
jgi:hypothetical protein